MKNTKDNIIEMRYRSTNDFVFQNGLEKEAEQLFGKDWEAEDDCNQIEALLKFVGAEFYEVEFIEEIINEEDISVWYNSTMADLQNFKNKFPNGFENWHETHFEVVQAITRQEIYPNSKTSKIAQEEGTGGLYLFAERLTNKFELKYKGVEWGKDNDTQYMDCLEEFLQTRI